MTERKISLGHLRWKATGKPYNGEREKARRLRQIAAGVLRAQNGLAKS